jgi:acetyl-CoA C-acetyltransferase
MVVSTIAELQRRQASVGCVAMCAGGGMGAALVLELASG